ncbi:hypothetical protein [Arthrobacter horti]|uniref:hypothetical protein n=1 Tax=Arthrobacter TaxID=1663 RepID=UPI0034608818
MILACRRDGVVTFVPHHMRFPSRAVPVDAPPEHYLARALSSCTVRLPAKFCRPERVEAVLNELERQGIAAWQKSPWLRGLLVLFLDDSMTASLDGVRLRYDQRIGLYEVEGDTC